MTTQTPRQKHVSIKIPDRILTIIDEMVRIGSYESRSHFLRVAIEELLKSELGTWEDLINQISNQNKRI
ncbi:MAG: ribbon-helix-helix domain-containing protein [Candidatus Thorarchaeota archaeon]